MRTQLQSLGKLLSAEDHDACLAMLEEMKRNSAVGKDHDSEKMLGYLMAVNLQKRFLGTGITENLYDSSNGVSQIRLFDILIHQFPFVKYGQEITNNAIMRLLADEEQACILDIGIGLGTQMLHILERANELSKLRKLTIVGIEPFKDALQTAAEKIAAHKDTVNFTLEFVGVPEYIERTNIKQYVPADVPLIVNASLALHHIKTSAERDRVIANIRALQPKALLLIEPNVDHFTNNLADRMLHCYDHFIGIFGVIDRLDANIEDRNGLKLFFGRELEDILSKADDTDRFEKHEPTTDWLHRLHQAGFATDVGVLLTTPKEVLGVTILPEPKGFVGFVEKRETILAIIYAH